MTVECTVHTKQTMFLKVKRFHDNLSITKIKTSKPPDMFGLEALHGISSCKLQSISWDILSLSFRMLAYHVPLTLTHAAVHKL